MPVEFGALTPGELFDLYDGYQRRERRRQEEEWFRHAWFTARIINSIPSDRKRAVQIADLLPAEFRGPPKTKEQILEELAEKQKRFEAAHARKAKLKLVKNG